MSPKKPSLPNAWPFQEAQKLIEHVAKRRETDTTNAQRPALLETGYGPSGLPHIGTFGEVARTSWVKQAYEELTGEKAKLLVFSDDMDGFRKVPENIPQQEKLAQFINQPLSKVPDPFGEYDSFAAHNNARLCRFLDSFGFDYEFASSTKYYHEGRFNNALKRVLECYESIMKVVLPTLRDKRQGTYSPVMPVHPKTGEVMQVAIDDINTTTYTVTWRDPRNDEIFETSILNGHAKMQWKVDWAMRWYGLGVDYEMSGKDLLDSVRLSSKIDRILGGLPPQGLTYELFLDEKGQKISKSKGNGISIEEWLEYAPAKSLAQFMYNRPQRAKRLYFDVIPKTVDEYLTFVNKYDQLSTSSSEETGHADKRANPVHFISAGASLKDSVSPFSFTMLLNLASVVNADNNAVLWGFIRRYDDNVSPEKYPMLDNLTKHAVAYYNSFVKPHKEYRKPTVKEKEALQALGEALKPCMKPDQLPENYIEKLAYYQEKTSSKSEAFAKLLQDIVFEIGKKYDFQPLKSWFSCLYEVLLGQKEGPRFGGFISLYGVQQTISLIDKACCDG